MTERIVPVGEELKYVGYRLNDIVFLAENTVPVGPRWMPWRWRHYSKSVLRIIADQAREAQRYMSVVSEKTATANDE